jgi:diguanylate cyclase (GGDEF)-like protein
VRGGLARIDDAGGLLPLVHAAARQYYRGDWEEAARHVDLLLPLAAVLGDRASARDARVLRVRVLEQVAAWPELQIAAEDLLSDEMAAAGPAASPVRAIGLGLLATALQQQGRVTDALSAAAEGYEILRHGTGWAAHRAIACFTLSTPLCAALLFEPALELLSAGETLARRERMQPWAVLTPARFAARRARTEALRGYFVELIGDDRGADAHYASSAGHALRAMRDAPRDSLHALRAEAGLTIALQRLRIEPVDRGALERHVAREPFARVALLSRLTLASVDARAGDLASARDLVGAVRTDASRLGELVTAYVATAWTAQLDEVAHGRTPATHAWRRVAEGQLRRLWNDRAGRFEALVSARQVEALSAVVEHERGLLWEDALTAVGNRRLLDRLLREPEVAARPTAFIDVDWFKQVNDRFGHAVGDEVLRRIATLLTAASRSGDVVVRFGGDEFVVVLGDGSNIEAYCERVRRSVEDHTWGALRPGLNVTVSVGGVRAGPRSMSRADAALRRAKAARVPGRFSGRDAGEWPA